MDRQRILKFNHYQNGKNYNGKEFDYDRIEKDFDHVVDALLDIIDEFSDVNLSFETACGQRVHLKYEDYIKKDEKYNDFIEALPILGEFFTVIFSFKRFDYEKTLLIAGMMESNIQRIIDINWEFEEFMLNSSNHSWASNYLSYKFTRGDKKTSPFSNNP